MSKKLLTLLAEEIKEQGFGRYFKDAILPSGQRIGDVKNVDLAKSKPIDITMPDTEELPSEVEDDVDIQIDDISGQSNYKNKGKPLNSEYFILHHTGGSGTPSGVINTLNRRKIGIQYIIDREGKVYRGLPKGSIGAHVKSQYPGFEQINNRSSEGVEIIAKNDGDVLDIQCKSALKLVKSLGYSQSNIYGHGEVSSNKPRSEGQKCKTYFKNNW